MRHAILLAAIVAAFCGCSKPEEDAGKFQAAINDHVASSDKDITLDKIEQGRRVYNFRCYYCHGYSGNAHTLAASFLMPKPRDFTMTSPKDLKKSRMRDSIRNGRPGTAMKSFSSVLSSDEIDAVVDFIQQEFMLDKAENTRYHTEDNGWFNHERYSAAFPFALGKIPLDTPWDQLSPEQVEGKRMFMTSCITCHDRANVNDEGAPWEARPVSYPRSQYNAGDYSLPNLQPRDSNVDAMASASPYLIHEIPPTLTDLTESERRGEALFQQNCAFCHGADGTGRNWIGSFLEPHPRDLTNAEFMSGMTEDRLRMVIRDGLRGTSMPAWKSVLSAQQIEDVIGYVGRAFHPLATEQ